MTGVNQSESTSTVNAKYFLNTGGADVSNFSSCDGATVFSIVCHMDVALPPSCYTFHEIIVIWKV